MTRRESLAAVSSVTRLHEDRLALLTQYAAEIVEGETGLQCFVIFGINEGGNLIHAWSAKDVTTMLGALTVLQRKLLDECVTVVE